MNITLSLGPTLGMLGVVFCLASFAMKQMLPLRAFALAGSACFIAYGYVESQLPSIVLNSVLLPLNAVRMWQIAKLSRDIAQAGQDSPVSQWLLPHMRRLRFKAGDVLFRKGDVADRLMYVTSGTLKLVEIGQPIGPGQLIGEIGLFSPEHRRTQSVVCDTDGELYYMTDEMIYQLYFQNPKLGFYLARLVAERLLRDVGRRERGPVTV